MITTEADEILTHALKQTETERARIAEALIASLDAPADREIERAWQKEIHNRLREIDTGVLSAFRGKRSGIDSTEMPMHSVDVHPDVYAELEHCSSLPVRSDLSDERSSHPSHCRDASATPSGLLAREGLITAPWTDGDLLNILRSKLK